MPSLLDHLAELQRSCTYYFKMFSRGVPSSRRRRRSIVRVDWIEPLEIRAVLSSASLLGIVGQLEATVLSVPSSLLGTNSPVTTNAPQNSQGASSSNGAGISLGNVLNQTLGNLNTLVGSVVNGVGGLSLNLSQSSTGASSGSGLLGIFNFGNDGVNLQSGSSSTTPAFGVSNSPNNASLPNNGQVNGVGESAINVGINPAIGPALPEFGVQLRTVVNGILDRNPLPTGINAEVVAHVGFGLEAIRMRHVAAPPVNAPVDRDDVDDAKPVDRGAAAQRREFKVAVAATSTPKQAVSDADAGEGDAFFTRTRPQAVPIAAEAEAAGNGSGSVAVITVLSGATLLARHFARTRDDALDAVFSNWQDHPIDETV